MKMTSSVCRARHWVIGFLLLAWGAQTTAAQTRAQNLSDLPLEELMRITVTTATRTAEEVGNVPARVEVVTADQIKHRGYRSLSDLLRDLPDFKVEVGADQDVPVDVVVQGIRGASRIVLLLDGIRISSPTNEPLPILANYPVHSARQVEVVYGPGSALYGADAFSAVVNIITKDVSDAEGVALTTSLGQFGLYNTAGSYGVRLGRRASLVVAGQVLYDRQPDLSRYYPDDFGGLDGQRSGTFNTIFGPMTPAPVSPAYRNPLSAHSLQAALRMGGLQLSLFENTSRVPTAPAYTPDNAVYSDEAFNRNTLLIGAGTYTRRVGGVTSTSSLMMSRHELDPESGYRNVFSNMERSYKYAYGFTVKAEQQASWRATTALNMTAGGIFEHFYAIPQGADLNAPVSSRTNRGTMLGTNIPDEFIKLRYENIGAYLQGQYEMTSGLTLTMGARGDYNTRYRGTFNPRLGLVWQPTDGTAIKLLYGTAFLAPSPYQAYGHYGSFLSPDGGETYTSGFWHLPNPDLRPQHKSTTELNVRQALSPHIDAWGAVFLSRFTDLVREGPDRRDRYAGTYHSWPVEFIEIPINEGRMRTYGGSVGLDVQRSLAPDRHLAARVALSLADGHVVNDRLPGGRLEIGGMAPVQLHVGADLEWSRWSVTPRLSLVGSQRVLATVTDGHGTRRRTLGGYASLNMNLRRERIFKGVDAFLTIENALDRRYRNINFRAYNNPEELLGAPQNPRRLTFGIDVRLP